MVLSCTRWLSIRLDLLSSLFVTIVAVAAILIVENPGESVQTLSDYAGACSVSCGYCFVAATALLNFKRLHPFAMDVIR